MVGAWGQAVPAPLIDKCSSLSIGGIGIVIVLNVNIGNQSTLVGLLHVQYARTTFGQRGGAVAKYRHAKDRQPKGRQTKDQQGQSTDRDNGTTGTKDDKDGLLLLVRIN
jgi:hypothetical protein